MPWCPECKVEYMDGFTHCYDCAVDLVDKLEPENKPEADEKHLDDDIVFLMECSSSIEAEMMKIILKDNGIQSLIKYKGTGSYLNIYMGDSIFGVDLFVPSSCIDKANELVNTYKATQSLNNDEDEDKEDSIEDNISQEETANVPCNQIEQAEDNEAGGVSEYDESEDNIESSGFDKVKILKKILLIGLLISLFLSLLSMIYVVMKMLL